VTRRFGRALAPLLSGALLASGLFALGPLAAVEAAPGEPSTPTTNPDLEVACGIDILVILDESGSVQNYKRDVQDAFRAFTSALKNTGSRLAVAEFSTVARLPLTGAAQTGYTTVTDASIASTFEPYIATQYNPTGSTNWEDGFRMGRYFLPRPSTQPHLVVFITDGNPNKIIREDRVTQNQYENLVPLSSNQVTDASENAAADRAVSNSNAQKALGSHVLALAVGDGLTSASSLSRLVKVSGPNVFPDNQPAFDIATTDVYREPDFAQLQAALRDAAFQLCSPSITVEKLVDLTPDTDESDAIPGAGFEVTAEVAPVPDSWVLPSGATGSTVSEDTDGSGFVTFQWNTTDTSPPSATITEVDPASVIPDLVYDPDLTRCTYRTPDQPNDQPLTIDTSVPLGFEIPSIPTDSIVTCRIYNVLPPDAAITLEKATNGVDADVAPGPAIPVGDAVLWEFDVVNTGNVTLTGVTVVDDPADAGDPTPTVTCPTSTLAPGESMTCTATGTARSGQYANTATVTGTSVAGPVTATDPSHYTGVAPGLTLTKFVDDADGNPQDANTAPGPYLPSTATPTWTYVVENTGAADLTDVTVVDSPAQTLTCEQGGSPITLPVPLIVGESFTCTATGTWQAGQYENTATTTGLAGAVTVADSDVAHYFGEVPAIDIEKATNGVDADVPPGPAVPVGDGIKWLYFVTNTGNVALDGLVVTDDDPDVKIACPRPVLLPGTTITCFAKGTATAGQYANVGTATANPPSGPAVTDTDPSHYFGVESGLTVEKSTNGEDADLPPGPFVPVGDPVLWEYLVTNTGNGPLTDVRLLDAPEGLVSCPKDNLAAGESMTCSGSGTAQSGQYANVVLARGVDELDQVLFADDPSHYYGAEPGILVEKSTNGDDADLAPGPLVPVGGQVDWSYEVTNTGNLPLTGVTVTDDQGVAVTCPQTTLDPLESMICTGSGTAVLGQYENVATATGQNGTGTVTDTDPSHYFGYVSGVALTKLTEDQDADDPTGPYIKPGDPVRWNYVITNTGNINLVSWRLTDSDPAVSIACPAISAIPPGGSITCVAGGTAITGQYENTATVVALDAVEDELTATDPSHYFGAAPAISLEKATNGIDADRPTGPRVDIGSTVTWTYEVTNTGNVALEGLVVTDDQIGTIACPSTTLAVGEVVVCRATGVAEEGQYANLGTATARFVPPALPVDTVVPQRSGVERSTWLAPARDAFASAAISAPIEVSDTDPSHYLGVDLSPGGGEKPPGPGDPDETAGTGGTLAALWASILFLLCGAIALVASRTRST
jgi:hypothetical protein